ncbi:hypothetical protein TNCV_4280141 [Trichonephila clavipes]|nr:hypothetical protein TNCV_4280141 [Trichonephila clavipes]
MGQRNGQTRVLALKSFIKKCYVRSCAEEVLTLLQQYFMVRPHQNTRSKVEWIILKRLETKTGLPKSAHTPRTMMLYASLFYGIHGEKEQRITVTIDVRYH